MGALLGLLAIFVYIGMTLPLQKKVERLSRELTQMQHSQNSRLSWKAGEPRTYIARFYGMLPSEQNVPDLLEQIVDAAFENNVALDQGQFKQTPGMDLPITQFEVVLPATGKYGDIRKFVSRVLTEMPWAALDGIEFKRDDAKNPELEAQVRLTLFLKAAQ